ncbi:hypothetical protein HPP92_005861 [Vanilla planifolia]|uniref:Uncharacterized protein n=1 Tax=Vanilla planifolia TaxID=51239 RepID=A0A835S0D7_VANPL|nr:hypothetical protein HPP92_005861 [Vanilla planifolia]
MGGNSLGEERAGLDGVEQRGGRGMGPRGGRTSPSCRTGVLAANVPVPLRPVFSVSAGPLRDPTRPNRSSRVLPGGLAMQVWQQTVHALNPEKNRRTFLLLPPLLRIDVFFGM